MIDKCKYYYRYYGKILSVLPSIIYNASHVNIPPFLGASGLLSRGRHKAKLTRHLVSCGRVFLSTLMLI